MVADLMSDEADSLYAVLCRIARDPAEPGSVRVAAAKAALAPVLSRLTAEVHVGGEWGRSFADLVAAAQKAGWAT